ncbi:hypothetical protein BG36_04960 [Aquamicrobium defluvii]|uniref:Uncharacterized protein n=1 Tax=Aquamicrobium defluvii TaxID=69279 RepID=A0A011VE20_9HYPH|nr:hypothetical protein BG36_04960 [Aquamicrobium defluvii]EZQ15863.1 hypothetical protein CF98_09770 [Halopseudomonas bauzanensis]
MPCKHPPRGCRGALPGRPDARHAGAGRTSSSRSFRCVGLARGSKLIWSTAAMSFPIRMSAHPQLAGAVTAPGEASRMQGGALMPHPYRWTIYARLRPQP